MRVLLTGATGVIGREAVPLLVAAGHHVLGVSRSTHGHQWLAGIGAEPVDVDLFDPQAVGRVVAGVEVVCHFATAIPPLADMADRGAWTTNDRLRTIATATLVDAALRVGARRFVQESITFIYADGGDAWIDEDFPVDPAREILESALDAESEVDRFTAGGGIGIALRMSSLYGPGRASAELIAAVAEGKASIVGDGDDFVSHLHVEDAGSALVSALSAPAGTYNVTDDQPVTSRRDLEALAAALGAEAPRARPAGPTSRSHRVSNRRFKETTGWGPRHATVLEGWPSVVNEGRATPRSRRAGRSRRSW